MSNLEQTIRFVVGVALVATGVSVAAPFVLDVVAAHAQSQAVSAPVASAQPAAGDGPPPARHAAHSIPDPQLGGWAHQPMAVADIPPLAAELAPAAGFLSRDFVPPPPPAPLPHVAADLSRSLPPLASAYRSTLDVPPPPLLDADSPPPLAVAWSANDAAWAAANRGMAAAPTSSGSPPTGNAAPMASLPHSSPTTYAVRDGDDLTGIATRIYGTPAAASAIWSVNRDRLTDPAVLPIGMQLRIPPSWSVPTARGQGGMVIEPAQRPTSVRVAPGETLETLAQRFYGDRAMASQLWEANRDRLRNPALVVAGMELRLP